MNSIIIIEDHSIVSFGVKALLEKENIYSVIGTYKSGIEGLKKVKETAPDVTIVDLSLGDMSGESIILNLKKNKIKTKILVLSRKKYLPQVTHLLKLGIAAYVVKDDAAEELTTALEAIVKEEVYISNSIKDLLECTGYLGQNQELSILAKQLTEREIEITRMLTLGKSNEDTAKILSIAPATIRVHVSNILKKLSLNNTRELISAGKDIF